MTTKTPHRARFIVCLNTEKATMDEFPWIVKRDKVCIARRRTKAEAVSTAAGMCRQREKGSLAEMMIMGRSGKVMDNRTYGADPVGTKG